MRQIIFSISALFLAIALIFLGHAMLGTLLPLRMGIAQFPSFVIGAVMSSYFVGLVCGTFFGQRLITNVGHIRTFSALASILSVAAVTYGFWVDPLSWSGLRFIQGFCLAGLLMCTESWLNERATNEIRGRILSFYMVTAYLAQSGGQFLLHLGDISEFALFVIASILFSLALVPVAATRIPAPELRPLSHFGLRQLYAASPLGVSGAFASGFITGGFYAMGPFFAQQLGLDVGGTARFMAAAIFGGLLLQWPVGRLSDRTDRRIVFGSLTVIVCLISLAFIAAAERGETVLLVLAAVFGGAIFTLYPLCAAHTNDHIESADLVRASGGMIVCYGLGAAVGPLGAAGLMTLLGPNGLFTFTAGVALTIAAYTAWRIRQRAAPSAEQQEPFQHLPQTTPVASELDPRGEDEEPTLDFKGGDPQG